jgi:hypothetical protein
MANNTPTPRTAEIALARDCDEKIAAAWDLYWEARKPIEAATQTITEARKRLRSTRSPETYLARIADAEARIELAALTAEPLRRAAIALDAALYTGWTRFYLVQHIHSSQHCSSFRSTTRVGWLPDVSGLTEAEAVAEHGAILCTICFPSAPTEWTEGPKDDRCTGSGKPTNSDLPQRRGYVAGNWVTCPDCGKQVGITPNGFRVPKHKAA